MQILFFLFLCSSLLAQEVDWARRITSEARDGVWDTKVTPSGDLLVLGFFEGMVDLGGLVLAHEDDQDFFLANYSQAGDLQWAVPFIGPGFDRGDRIAVDPNGNIYVGGLLSNTLDFSNTTATSNGGIDIFFASFDSDGDLRWETHFGGASSDICYGVYADGDELLAVGHFNGTVDFGFGNVTSEGLQDMWIMSLNKSSGQPNWVKTYGGPGQDRLNNVTKDKDGNILICGYFSSTMDFGNQTLESEGGFDVFFAKVDETGDPLWAVVGNSPGSSDQAADITTDSQGNVYVSGTYEDQVELDGFILEGGTDSESFIAAFDADGDWKWGKSTVTDDNSSGARLTLVNDQYLYQGTTISNGTLFDGTAVSNLEEGGVLITGFDLNGNVLNYLLHDGQNNDYALPIDNNGQELFYGGAYEDGILIGSTFLDGEGDQDIFIVRADPQLPTAVTEPLAQPVHTLANVRLDAAARLLYVDVIHPEIESVGLFDLQGRLLEQREAGQGLQLDLSNNPAAPVVLFLQGQGIQGGQVILLH